MKKALSRAAGTNDFTKYWHIVIRDRAQQRNYREQYAQKYPTRQDLIVFESFWGQQYSDGPRALYEALLAHPEGENYRKIWVFKEPEKFAFLAKQPNTKLVKYRSEEYYRCMASARIWVYNCRVPNNVRIKKDQIYLQLWHGTPLKRLGHDVENYGGSRYGQKLHEHSYDQDAVQFTYMASPSPFYKEKITSAFNLKAFGKEDIFIDSCYPRNDFLFRLTDRTIRELRQSIGIPEGKRVILYAPTFRETDLDAMKHYQYRLAVDFSKWRECLGDDAVILFRTHYLVSGAIDLSAYEGFVINVTDYGDIRDLYAVSDLLITDYSSVFFDFANLKRPMIFFMYDYESYKYELRGFYIDENELPGPIVKTEEELLALLPGYQGEGFEERYRAFNQKFNPWQDGKGSETIWAAVLNQKGELTHE